MRSARSTATLLLALTFIVGGLSGMALEEAAGLDWFDFLDSDPQEMEATLMEGITLSASQRAGVERVLDRQEDELEAYWTDRLPAIDSLLRRSYADLRTLLTPEQQAVFDARVERIGARVPKEFHD